MSEIPDGLIRAVRDGSLVPFVGTGLSMTVRQAQLPSWPQLVERLEVRLRKEGHPKEADKSAALRAKNMYPEAAQLANAHLGRLEFLNEIAPHFVVERPTDADVSVVEAVWRLSNGLVVTTNYDDVLCWPFQHRVPYDLPPPYEVSTTRGPSIVHCDQYRDLAAFAGPQASRRACVWHIHGSIHRTELIVLAAEQYEELYKGKDDDLKRVRAGLEHLRQLVARRPLLFVGFSLQDPFVRDQLERALELTRGHAPVHYALIHRGEVDADEFWRRWQVRAIEFEGFGAPMVRRVRTLVRVCGRRTEPPWHPDLPPHRREIATKLLELLADEVLAPARVAAAYAASKPANFLGMPSWGDGELLLHVAVARLANAITATGAEAPLIVFARTLLADEALAKDELRDPARAEIETWCEHAETVLRRPGQVTVRATDPKERRTSVRLDITPLRTQPGSLRAQAWAWIGDEQRPLLDPDLAYERGTLEVLFARLKRELEGLGVPRRSLHLSIALPRELLVADLDQTRPLVGGAEEFDFPAVSEPPIGASFPLTVRPLWPQATRPGLAAERLRQAWKQWHEFGVGQLGIVELDDEQAPLNGALWLGSNAGFGTLIDRLVERRVSCAVLASPPEPRPARATVDLLSLLLQAGVPIVLWLRESLAPEQLRERVQALLARGSGHSLPEVLLDVRSAAENAQSAKDDPDRAWSLLWEDPDLLLPQGEPILVPAHGP